MPLKNNWTDIIDGQTEIVGENINIIAHAVIELEENPESGGSILVDIEMSDTSENAVQNKVIKAYVDETKTELQAYLNEQILGGSW